MTKRELLRQINAICQELREVSRNSENPEELYDLNTMVENLKDQVEEDNKGMETQISEKLRELGINLGQSQMDTLATSSFEICSPISLMIFKYSSLTFDICFPFFENT